MLKFGIISEAKPGFARVQFVEDDSIVSDWLPIAVPFTIADKAVWTLKVQMQVACLMDENCETGVIIGATYNDTDTAPTGNANIFSVEFADGTKLSYDKNAHELKADVKGKVTVTATEDIEATSTTNIKATALKITLDAPEVDITAPIMKFTGALTVEGMITAGGIAITTGLGGGTGKMTGDGDIETTGHVKAANVIQGTINLGTHIHSGVTTGTGTSGAPVP